MKLRNDLRILFLGMCLSLGALPAVQAAPTGASATAPVYGPELEGFDYPYPVRQFNFTSQGAALHMAYMDVKAATPNGRTVVLMHGKNYCGATWEPTIKALNAAGYRVIALDQIGFCKSSKPEHPPVSNCCETTSSV